MAESIGLITAGLSLAGSAAGVVAASKMKKKGPDMLPVNNREVKPNDDAALRNAQDMARRRKGVAATILTDGTAAPANAVASKTLLGQ